MRVRVVMLLVACLGLPLSLAPVVRGADDPRHVQIQAAQADALASLVDQVRLVRLSPELTVGEFLEGTGGEDALRRSIARDVELIGATRWPNPGTCQVQLEVRGDRVARALTDLARERGAKSPLPAEVIQKRLGPALASRTFAATGTSATPDAVAKMRPGPEHPLWLTVPEADRREAVVAAQRNAARRAMGELSDVPLGDGKSLSDALEIPAVRDAVQDWVATRPLTNIEFRDNGEVRLTVAAPGEDLWVVLREALSKQDQIPTPRDEAGWQRLHDQVVVRLRPSVGGRSSVGSSAGAARPAPSRPAVRQAFAPQQPPRWAEDQLTAQGRAAGDGPRLRLVHAAQQGALDDLRTQVRALRLPDGRTLGDLAAEDRGAGDAIERSLLRARIYKADYGAERDSVTVSVSLDLRHVWQELAHP